MSVALPPKRRALIILPEAAYPVAGGGPLRTACMLEFLRAHFEIHAIHFRLAGDPNPLTRYPANQIARHALIDLPRHSKKFLPRLARNLLRAARGVPPLVDRFSGGQSAIARFIAGQTYDLAWCEHFWTAPYAPLFQLHARKLVVDLHNIESEYFRLASLQASPAERPIWKRFENAARSAERRLLPHFHYCLTASSEDAARIDAPTAVIPNTIPPTPLPAVEKSHSLAFSGNFAYAPNLDGMRWFVKFVWPKLFLSFPALRLRVLGKEAELVASLFTSLERVDIVGPIAHAVEEIAKSQVAIAPLLFGSGTRLKILEAWAAGTPVVSTPLGAEGLGAVAGQHLEIAETPELFARRIEDLLRNELRRHELARTARILLETRFTWTQAHNLLADLEL